MKFKQYLELCDRNEKLLKILENNINEWSKNDPIPEVSRSKNGVYLTMIGPPAAGKSTFINKYVSVVNSWKVIDPDEINYILSSNRAEDREYGKWNSSSSRIYSKYIKNIFNNETKPNVIFDNTGNNFERNMEFINYAKAMGYTTVMICVLNTTNKILQNNIKRAGSYIKKDITGQLRKSRTLIPNDYLESILSKITNLISEYKNLKNLDKFYIVLNTEAGYKFLRFDEDNKLEINDKGIWIKNESLDDLEELNNWIMGTN